MLWECTRHREEDEHRANRQQKMKLHSTAGVGPAQPPRHGRHSLSHSPGKVRDVPGWDPLGHFPKGTEAHQCHHRGPCHRTGRLLTWSPCPASHSSFAGQLQEVWSDTCCRTAIPDVQRVLEQSFSWDPLLAAVRRREGVSSNVFGLNVQSSTEFN